MLEWLFGRKPKKPKWTVVVNSSVQTNKASALAWTLYENDGTTASDCAGLFVSTVRRHASLSSQKM